MNCTPTYASASDLAAYFLNEHPTDAIFEDDDFPMTGSDTLEEVMIIIKLRTRDETIPDPYGYCRM